MLNTLLRHLSAENDTMDIHQLQNERIALSNLLTSIPQKPEENARRIMLPTDAPFFLRKRYLVCFLTNVGYMLQSLLRSNLSIALVEMTSEKTMQMNNETFIQKAEFDWDMKTKGIILSVFSIGYACGPLGGILALRLGCATTAGISLLVTAIFNILTPYLVRQHILIYLAARLLEGVFESFVGASCLAWYVLWAFPNERSCLTVFSVTGIYLGHSINYPLAGFLANKYGWESIFYVPGGLTIIWSVIWFICVPNDPTKDRLMTKLEVDRFKTYVIPGNQKKKTHIPWKQIFRSKPFWAYFNEFFSFYWTQSFLVNSIPLYIKDLYDVNIQEIGLISGIPSVTALFGLIISSLLSDYLRNHSTFKKESIHRVFIAIGQTSFVIGFVYCGLWADFKQSIIGFTLARLFAGTSEMTYQVLTIDMFGEYTGLIRGFGITATSLSYFLNPIFMGYLVSDHNRSSWNIYFLFLSVFNMWSLVIFFLYGSGKLQEWAVPSSENEIHKNKSDDAGLETS